MFLQPAKTEGGGGGCGMAMQGNVSMRVFNSMALNCDPMEQEAMILWIQPWWTIWEKLESDPTSLMV